MSNKDAYTRSYVGKGFKDADENGYETHWDSSHEDLMPTSYIKIDYHEYCIYCGERMKPIQAGLKKADYNFERNYDVTGYACDCDKAEKEVEIQKQIEKLNEKYKENLEKLKTKLPKENLTIIKRLLKKSIDEIDSLWDIEKTNKIVDPYKKEEE